MSAPAVRPRPPCRSAIAWKPCAPDVPTSADPNIRRTTIRPPSVRWPAREPIPRFSSSNPASLAAADRLYQDTTGIGGGCRSPSARSRVRRIVRSPVSAPRLRRRVASVLARSRLCPDHFDRPAASSAPSTPRRPIPSCARGPSVDARRRSGGPAVDPAAELSSMIGAFSPRTCTPRTRLGGTRIVSHSGPWRGLRLSRPRPDGGVCYFFPRPSAGVPAAATSTSLMVRSAGRSRVANSPPGQLIVPSTRSHPPAKCLLLTPTQSRWKMAADITARLRGSIPRPVKFDSRNCIRNDHAADSAAAGNSQSLRALHPRAGASVWPPPRLSRWVASACPPSTLLASRGSPLRTALPP